jgi:aryl-alcohol dehydrogenase-like predicted oxidoreductase
VDIEDYIKHLKCIKDDNLENNILAWKNDEPLETNLSPKHLNIIYESNLDNYNYYTNNFLNSKNNNHILSYKLSSQNIDSILNKNNIKQEIDKQLNSMKFKNIEIIYWFKKELEESEYAEIIKKIKIRNNKPYIGVLNHNLEGIKKIHNILVTYGLKLFAVKSDYNVFKRFSQILDYCKENNIYFFSCDVFEKGILSGKYNSDNCIPEKPNEEWRNHYNNQIQKIEKLNNVLKMNYKDASQIPIAYNISKGTIPVITFNKLHEFLNNQETIQYYEDMAFGFERSVDMAEIEIYEE